MGRGACARSKDVFWDCNSKLYRPIYLVYRQVVTLASRKYYSLIDMEQQGRLSTSQDNNTNISIDTIAAGLSLAVLVAIGTLGNILLLVSVGSAMRTVLHQWQRLVHDLVFMYGCLEVLFFSIPCLLSTYAYLTSWRVDTYQSVCDFFGWVVSVMKFGSLWIITLLAVERYLIICRQSGLSNRFAWKMRYTAFGGIAVVAIFAAVPLIAKTSMVTSLAVPHTICHFDFTPRTTDSQAVVITSIVLAYVMFQVSLFCHVSIFCQSSRDVKGGKAPSQDGATDLDRDHHRLYTLVYAITPLTLWVWVCMIPLWITLIMAQTGFEVGPGLEFGVLRTLTVCSAFSPYILLSSSGYYRTSLCSFICCRNVWSSGRSADEQRITDGTTSVLRCADCHAHIARYQEHGQRINTITTSVESRDTVHLRSANQIERDVNCTSHQHAHIEEMASNGHSDWPKVDVENHAHQIPGLDYCKDEHASTSTPGMFPNDSRVYLLSAGENGELVCRGSFDGGSFRDDNECSSLRSDQGSNSSRGSSILDGYTEEEYYRSDGDQTGGYLITLPVNMPGQGLNETVERIFYIQEPLQRSVGSCREDKVEDLQDVVTEDTTARVEGELSPELSLRSDMAHLSRPNLASLVTHENDSGSDEELEDEELSRVEAEIRGRIMGRSYLGKMRRSNAPQPMAVREGKPVDRRVKMSLDNTTMDVKAGRSDQDSPSLSQRGIREQDIKIHGPSVSDPHLVTLAFQQAMLAHAQQNMTDGLKKEKDVENGQSTGVIHKNSLGQLIPVINITPAQSLDDVDEVQPIFDQRSRQLDYRFLAPIAEEVGFVGDRSQTRTHSSSSILNTKHEKVYRVPKTNVQIMSNWKLQEDIRCPTSSPQLVIQMQNKIEPPREDDTKATGENASDVSQRCPTLEGESVDSACDLATKYETAAGEEESSKNMSPRTLEKVGNVIEKTVEGKKKTTDLLLETSEWINVENVMQGNINLGFVATEDDGLESKDISSPNTTDRPEYSSSISSIEVDFVHKDADTGPVEFIKSEVDNGLNIESGVASGSAHSGTFSRREENGRRPSGSLMASEDSNLDMISFKKVLPLKRQERVSDHGDGLNGQSADNVSTHLSDTKFTIQEVNDKITMSKHSKLGSENDLLIEKNLGNVGVDHIENSIDGERQEQTHWTENEESANKARATNELVTSHAKGKRFVKSALSGVNSYPLTCMRAFSIDGNLYVMYPNKKKVNNSNLTREGLRRFGNEMSHSRSSLSNGSDSTVEGLSFDRRSSLPIPNRVKFMNTVKKRDHPGVQTAMV